MSPLAGRKLAHELCNQLGIVITYAELLLEELAADNPNRPDIERIDRAALRLRQLFDGVVSFDEVGEDAQRHYGDELAAIERGCASVLVRLADGDSMAADVREMLKAADAVTALVSGV